MHSIYFTYTSYASYSLLLVRHTAYRASLAGSLLLARVYALHSH